jgi:release factor glutamine methyltransferase
MEPVYRPSDDSYLLLRHVEQLVSGEVLDMGTGSGIQAVAAALKKEVSAVTAVDINPAALIEAERRKKKAGVHGKMRFTLSDLFSCVDGVFDWIIFNPPYLPSEGETDEASWAGGGDGGDVIRRFLAGARSYLKPSGSIIMVYSSLTGVDENDFKGYTVEVLEEQPLFYEILTCVRLIPS